MYNIVVDHRRALVRVDFGDVLWTEAMFGRFRSDSIAAVQSLGVGAGQHRVLMDVRKAVTQAKNVIEAIQLFTARSTASRIAFVLGTRSALAALQVRDGVRVFDDLAAAEAWLSDRKGCKLSDAIAESARKPRLSAPSTARSEALLLHMERASDNISSLPTG